MATFRYYPSSPHATSQVESVHFSLERVGRWLEDERERNHTNQQRHPSPLILMGHSSGAHITCLYLTLVFISCHLFIDLSFLLSF